MLLPMGVWGQDFAADLKKINERYGQITEIDIKMSRRLYPNAKSSRPFMQESYELKQQGALQHTRHGELESLNNQKYLILVDHEDKNISVQPSIDIQGPFMSFPIPIDSLLPLYDSIQYTVLGKGLSKYILYISDFTYEKIELFFYPANYLIQKAVFYSATVEQLDEGIPAAKARFEIKYERTRIKPDFPAGTFSEKKFIKVLNGKISCSDSFKNYHLINYLP